MGEENAYIFGAKEEELPELRRTYDPRNLYETVPGLKRALDAFVDGTLDDGGTGLFHDLLGSLLDSNGYEPADVYYVLGDFADYREVRDRAALEYADQIEWARKCWINSHYLSGRFLWPKVESDLGRRLPIVPNLVPAPTDTAIRNVPLAKQP